MVEGDFYKSPMEIRFKKFKDSLIGSYKSHHSCLMKIEREIESTKEVDEQAGGMDEEVKYKRMGGETLLSLSRLLVESR